jgi:hypothetical protein
MPRGLVGGPGQGLEAERVRRELQLHAQLSHVNIAELKRVRGAARARAPRVRSGGRDARVGAGAGPIGRC